MNSPIRFGLEQFCPNFQNPGPYTFSISLDGKFASSCLSRSISPEQRNRFNEIGSKIIKKVLRDNNPRPYIFEGDSLLLAQCDLGRGGRYLSADLSEVKALVANNGAIEYCGHNIDTVEQAYTLLSLFTTWAEYADALLD